MPARISAVLASLILCFGAALPSAASVSLQHKHYHAHGIHFDYPENWVITSEQASPSGDTPLSVIIEGPDQSLAIIDTTPVASPLREFAETFSSTITRTITAAHAHVLGKTPALEEISPTRINERLVVSTADNSRMVFSRTYRMITGTDKTAYLITQSSRDDLGNTRPGFEMIERSLELDPASR